MSTVVENEVVGPELSEHLKNRVPSAIRLAHMEFLKRKDKIEEINTAIGNVSLPVHPEMEKRLHNLDAEDSPFKDGVIKYTATVGDKETQRAFLNIIASSGFDIEGLHCQVTDGGSQAMELVVLGVCGPAGSYEKPLLLIDATYINYGLISSRLGRKTISVTRYLQEDGQFTMPDKNKIKTIIKKYRPGGLLVIPYDNPTGQFYSKDTMLMLAELCIKHNMWMISDETYRELFYTDNETTSIWGITDKEIHGIEGRRISIESASKVWNACGLRIGALITDNRDFHEKSVAENTGNLCPNAIGQYIFGSLAHVEHEYLKKWYKQQRAYYSSIMTSLKEDLQERLPGIIISCPQASIYSVVDVRNIAKPGFNAVDFIMYCAREGKVKVNGKAATLLVSPMASFYNTLADDKNPGHTQMRIAHVETPEKMKLVPILFSELFRQYESRR